MSLPAEPVEVVHGSADAEEVAALVAVLVSHRNRRVPPPKRRTSGWTDRRRGVRAPLAPGLGAWSSSLRS